MIEKNSNLKVGIVMELLVEFKKRLKDIQKHRKQDLKEKKKDLEKLEEYVDKCYFTPPFKDLSYEELQVEFPVFYNWFKNFDKLVKMYEKHGMKCNKVYLLYTLVKNVLDSLQDDIIKYQTIIDVCDDDKVKSPIRDFDYLLMSLELANMSSSDSFTIFGMFCNYCANYLKTNPNYEIKNEKVIRPLGFVFF